MSEMDWPAAPPPNPDLVEDRVAAEAAKEAGMSKALRAERIALWREDADGWLDRLPRGVMFTLDDVVRACGLPDHGAYRNNSIGGWTSAKSKTGAISFTGEFRKSQRVIGHGNLQRVWVKL